MIYKKLQKDLDLQAVAYLKGEADKPFDGLHKIVNDEINDTTDILLIHGVRSQKQDNFQPLIDSLTSKLKLVRCEEPDTLPQNPNSEAYIRLHHYQAPDSSKQVRFYDIYWSPVTDPVKQLIYDSLDNLAHRTILSQQIKQKFLIDVFADLALYLGNYKRLIQAPVDQAFDEMLESPSTKKVLITGSFGSKIVFDVLIRRKKTAQEIIRISDKYLRKVQSPGFVFNTQGKNDFLGEINILKRNLVKNRDSLERVNFEVDEILAHVELVYKRVEQIDPKDGLQEVADCIKVCTKKPIELEDDFDDFFIKIEAFFMLSNQLPFTSMMELRPETRPDRFVQNIYYDLDKLFENGKRKEALKIISFYDPNDVFGYRLPPLSSNSKLDITNVEVNNTIPLFFNPDSLRVKYLSSPGGNGLLTTIRKNLRQDMDRQALVIDIDEPNETAKNNGAIIEHLIHGDQLPHIKNREQALTKVYRKSKKKPAFKEEVKYRRTRAQADTMVVTYNKPSAIRDFFGKQIINSFVKRVDKLDVKKAYLPYEWPAKGLHFQGLQEALDQTDTLHILTMHGMVSKSPEHFDGMIEKLSLKLEFNQTSLKEKLHPVYLGEQMHMAGNSQIKITQYTNSKGQVLRFYVAYWSPITTPPKDILKALDATHDMKSKRSAFPTAIKEMLINDGFCDVTLSLRTFRPMIDRTLMEAFKCMASKDPFAETIVDNRASQDRNIFFISGSLGSKLLFDYFSATLKVESPNLDTKHITIEERGRTRRIARRLHTYFMLSNQLALISIRDMDPGLVEAIKKNGMDTLTSHMYNNLSKHLKDTLHIVSFYDPNDILGFKLADTKNDSKLKVTNVPISLAPGYDIDVRQLLKLCKKVDKVLFKAFPKDEELNRRQNKKQHRELLEKINISITHNLRPYLDLYHPRQTFVFDINAAHSGGKDDDRVIEMISYGTKNISRRKD